MKDLNIKPIYLDLCMSTFEVRVRLLSTLRLTSNGDRRTGRGFMKVEKKDLKIWLVVIF